MRHTGENTVSSEQGGGSGEGRTRQRWLIVTVAVGAFMLVAAVGWACTVGQMKGALWFSGATGTNVIDDGATSALDSCPTDSSQQVSTGYVTGDVVCVQAKGLQVHKTHLPESDDPDNPGHFMRLYELKYAPTYGHAKGTVEEQSNQELPDVLTDAQQEDVNGDLCHQSRQTLPNRSRADGLYKASTADNYGWEDQKTVLDMPQGTYTVCAATVVLPGAGVMTGLNHPSYESYFDAGPDGDPTTGHGSITITGSP